MTESLILGLENRLSQVCDVDPVKVSQGPVKSWSVQFVLVSLGDGIWMDRWMVEE